MTTAESTQQTAMERAQALLAQKSTDFVEKLAPSFPGKLLSAKLEETPADTLAKNKGMAEVQFVLRIDPLSWKTSTGNPLIQFVNITDNVNSTMFILLEDFKAIQGIALQSLADLEQYAEFDFEWQRTPIRFGPVDKKTGQRTGKAYGEYYRPLRVLSSDEVQQMVEEAKARREVATQPSAPVASIDNENDAILALVGEGISSRDFKKSFMADPSLRSVSALASEAFKGSLLDRKVDEGILVKDGDTYRPA